MAHSSEEVPMPRSERVVDILAAISLIPRGAEHLSFYQKNLSLSSSMHNLCHRREAKVRETTSPSIARNVHGRKTFTGCLSGNVFTPIAQVPRTPESN
jgi:hypothetical protein